MIVEPASLHSRSPLRRLLRAASFVAPGLLLVVAVAVGLAGPKPEPSPSVPASLADATSASSPQPTTATVPSAAPTLLAAPIDFPAAYASLTALRPAEVLAQRASPGGPPAVLAVAGYLGLAAIPTHCDAPMITYGAWCERSGTLSETPFGSLGGGATGRPPHLHVVVPAGVVLPVDVVASGAGADAVPVVAVGRFAKAGSCGAATQTCDQGFVVERVVWSDGATTDEEPLVEPGRDASAAVTPTIAVNTAGATLLAVLARPATVARLDPVAGAAAIALRPRPALVWYVRELEGLDTPTPGIHWVLFDPARGNRLASGPSPMPSTAVAPAASPSASPGETPAG